jgi:hypothetical protein
MKTYNQFVAESYSARENIQEIAPALALLPAAGKALGYGFAAYQAYQAAQKLRKGDYRGAAVDAALAVPSARVATGLGRVFKWGQRGKNIAANTMRTAKAGTIVKQTADEINAPQQATAKGPVDPSVANTPPTTKPTDTKPAPPTTKPSSVVLARKGGVQGKLDKATGKWTKGDWTKQESDRYKRVAAQKAAAAAPKPTPVVRSNNINLPSGVASKPVVKKSVPVGDTIKTKVNPDSSLEVTQKRSKAATEKIKKSLDIN